MGKKKKSSVTYEAQASGVFAGIRQSKASREDTDTAKLKAGF